MTGATGEDAARRLITTSASAEDGGDTIVSWSAAATTADGATIANNSNGTFTYDPTTSTSFETLPVEHHVTDSFTYTVTDNHGISATATASVLVTITDGGPTANAVTSATGEDASTLITTSASTKDGADTIVRRPPPPPMAPPSPTTARTFTYDPTASTSFDLPVGTTLTDSFTYTVTDNHGSPPPPPPRCW